MRRKIIAGNWKMNKTPKEALEFVNAIKDKVNNVENEVVFCVPHVDLIPVIEALKGTNIYVGAQNMHYEDKGAYTGEISYSMLTEIGVKYVIIGHSERRAYFNETNQTVNKKVLKACECGLLPIICVGEDLSQREKGLTLEYVRKQVKEALFGVETKYVKDIVIAYEPIWAIGTGKTATAEQAEEVCKEIRDAIEEMYDKDTAEKIRVQYGGSVNGSNAEELFSMPNIDGGLIGGASLNMDFENIAKA